MLPIDRWWDQALSKSQTNIAMNRTNYSNLSNACSRAQLVSGEKLGMLPHLQHTPAEVTKMVEYVYSVSADSSNPNARGFRNELTMQEDAGSIVLEASYVDLGRGEIPKIIGIGSVQLRSRHLQAEAADQFAGTRPLGSGSAEGKQFMGAIEDDGFLKFARVRFDDIKSIKASVASAGVGGVIEVRRGSIDGQPARKGNC